MLIYCYIRKVSTIEQVKTPNKRLSKVKGESVKLKEAVVKMEEELRILGQQSAVMECEASDASKARDRAEELKGLEPSIPNSRRIIPSSRRIWGSLRRGIP